MSDLTSALTPERAKYFYDLGLFAEAEFIANALLDEAVCLLGESNIALADKIVTSLLEIGLKLRHLNYIKALCLIEQNNIQQSKSYLEAELQIDPGNDEAKELLRQVIESDSNDSNRPNLLVGPVSNQVLAEAIEAEARKPIEQRNLCILIQPKATGGEYLGEFEKQCNQVISQKDAWSFVKLLRGKMPEALEVYKLTSFNRLGN